MKTAPVWTLVAALLAGGCAAHTKLLINDQVKQNCPELSGAAPKDMGEMSLMLIDTSAQYNACRNSALGLAPK